MVNKKSNARKTAKKPARKPAKKPRKAKAAAPPRRRIKRSAKSTQVTGPEIDKEFNDLLDKTPVERKIEGKMVADEEDHLGMLISTNYEEPSPFDPDEDIDEEPENRTKMYEVPPKPRSPERGNSATNEPVGEESQDEQTKLANRAYECFFNWEDYRQLCVWLFYLHFIIIYILRGPKTSN